MVDHDGSNPASSGLVATCHMDFWQVGWQIGTGHNAFCNTREGERYCGQMKVGAGEVSYKNGGIAPRNREQ
jgi:hypothetical protein